MVLNSENNANSNRKKIRRPPMNPLSLSKIGKSKSLLQLSGGKPSVPEPDYEEIGPPKRKTHDGEVYKPCDLCGSSEAAVRCDKCGSQCFCFACDDMYHRHPKRCTHARKAVQCGPEQVKPPLPPKGIDNSIPPPQPPPRKNKRPSFLSSTSFIKKDNGSTEGAGRTIMGSIKRIMGSRPLPPPPPPHTSKRPESETRVSSIPSRSQSRTSNRPSTAPATPNSRESSIPPDISASSKPVLPNQRDPKYQTINRPLPPPPPVGPHRKLSLQHLPSSSFEDKRASLVEGSSTASQWDSDSTKIVQRMRSQSISDDQWAQMMAAQTASQQFPQGHTPQDIAAIAAARRGFNAQGNSTRPSNFGVRGMVSSTSVCDLNSLSQQPQQNQLFNGQGANSFQQLNMMGYNHGMMWAPCDMCQGPPIGYPSSGSNNGMKRTASNLSMNLSSVGSDVSSGYPWGPPPGHLHHHMPFYPGCYPPPNCHSHMGHGVPMQGSAVSIPDSMQTFNKVSTSPAPSVRSSSHRSHKSSKSRSFNNSDKSRSSRIKSRHQSEESEDSRTSSYSEEEADAKITKNSFPNSNLAWQCDHCTFINPGNVRACGMCSKTAGTKQGKKSTDKKRNDHRRRDREKCRKTDHEDDDRNISDYDNENSIIKSNMSFSLKDFKKEAKSKISSANRTSNRYRKKSRRRESSFDSASPSISDIEDEERQLERQLKELRLSARSRQSGDYEGSHNRFRNNDRSSRKREGKHK